MAFSPTYTTLVDLSTTNDNVTVTNVSSSSASITAVSFLSGPKGDTGLTGAASTVPGPTGATGSTGPAGAPGTTDHLALTNIGTNTHAQIDAALPLKAPLASPDLTGTPTTPTAVAGTNTTQIASTAYVKTAVDNVINAAPGLLDTLDELAAALGDDANFASTVTNSLAGKQSTLVYTIGTAPADYVTDGVNDEAQFNAAITALNAAGGGQLYAKDISYHVGSSPIALKDKVWIRGAGRNVTTFYGDATLGTNAVMLATATLANPLTDCTLSDFKIDGSSMPTSPVSTFRKGIDALYTKRMLVFNIHIYKTPATGFGPDCNIQFQIDNCIFEECGTLSQNPGYNGLGIGTGYYANESCIVSNCIAINCHNNGFLLEYVGGGFNSRDYQFVNCYAYNNKRGFRVSGASGATFLNCKSINSLAEGYYIQQFGSINAPSQDIKIIGCDAYNNGDDGIYFKDQEYGQTNIICEGNHIYSNAGDGIVSGGLYTQIRNNVVWDNNNDGIYYHANSGTTIGHSAITGNVCYNNGKAGVSGRSDGLRVHGELGLIENVIVEGNQCFDNQQIITLTDGAMTAASFTLTSATASFKTTDIGKSITINGAGVAGVNLTTTIASYTSATSVKTTVAASTTVIGATVNYGSAATQQFGITIKDYVNNITVSNNVVHDNTKTGIFYQIATATTAFNAKIIDNVCYNNGKAGVATVTDGIRVWGSGVGSIAGVLLRGNRCYDDQASKTQTYGIAIKDNVTELLVIDNDVRSNLTGGILDSPASASVTNTYQNNKGHNPKQVYAQGNVTGATTFNRLNGDMITATLTGNITVALTVGTSIGDRLTLILTQDVTGSRIITLPANAKLAHASYILSTTPADVDTITFRYDGTNWREISRSVARPTSLVEGGTGATTAADARTNLGLGNVDNTSDLSKPVSTAAQTALDGKINDTGDTMTGQFTIQNSTADSLVIDSQGTANALIRFRDDGVERAALFVANGAAGLTIRSQSTLVLQSNNSTTARTINLDSTNFAPTVTNVLGLGSSSIYWSNLYATRLNINATAYLDGATAGQAKLTGGLTLVGTGGTSAEGITFGTDTNLYRSAVDTLKTDDKFNVITNSTDAFIVGDTAGANILIVDTTNKQVRLKAGASSGQIAKVGGTIQDHYTDSSVGGLEADIYTYTTLANTLATNGDKITATYGGNFVTVGTEMTQLKAYFAGTAIWDSTAIAVSTGTTSWRVVVELIRVSATVIRYTVSLNTTGASGFVYATSGELTALTLSAANIIKLTGTSSGVGSGLGDIIGKMGSVKWNPAA